MMNKRSRSKSESARLDLIISSTTNHISIKQRGSPPIEKNSAHNIKRLINVPSINNNNIRYHQYSITPSIFDSNFYAGATFDNIPKLPNLPKPPGKFMATDLSEEEHQRSQSTPSSPVTTISSMMVSNSRRPLKEGIKLDLESLFSTKKISNQLMKKIEEKNDDSQSTSSTKTDFCDTELGKMLSSASRQPITINNVNNGPVELLNDKSPSIVMTPSSNGKNIFNNVEKRETISSSSNNNRKSNSKRSLEISGQDLMTMLTLAATVSSPIIKENDSIKSTVSSSPCHLTHHHDSTASEDQYKTITNQLKSILNVTAAA